MLDLILTNKEKLVGNVRLKGVLGFSDHEVVWFKVLRARIRAQSITPHFRITDFGPFKDLLNIVPCEFLDKLRHRKEA